MPKAIYKISAIILCGLLIYNSLGYFVVISVMRLAVRHQQWVELSFVPEKQLTSFTFDTRTTISGLTVINNREIMVNDKLYDVVRQIENGGITTYYCYYDEKEQNLIAQTRLFDSMNQPVPVKNTTKLILEQIIKTALIEYQTAYNPVSNFQIHAYYNKETYSGPLISILSPPPEPS